MKVIFSPHIPVLQGKQLHRLVLRGTALVPSTLETGNVDAVHAQAPVTALAFDSRGVTVSKRGGDGRNGFLGFALRFSLATNSTHLSFFTDIVLLFWCRVYSAPRPVRYGVSTSARSSSIESLLGE